MHSIKIAICGTGRSPRKRGLMLLTYFNFNRTSQPFLTACSTCYILTISYLRTSGVLISNTCSEISSALLNTLPQPAAHQCSTDGL
jgi:hypothetical protein